VSYWPAILITGAVSIVSAFGALWVRDGIDRRARFSERQWEAYQRLAAASEIIAVRSAVYNSLRSPRSALGDTLQGTIKFILVLFLAYLRPFRTDLQRLKVFADALPTPAAESSQGVDQAEHLFSAMDDLVRARVEVHLVGSPKAIPLADQLLDRSREFLEAAESRQKSLITGWTNGGTVEPQRQRMLDAHNAFLDQVRHESKSLKIAKRHLLTRLTSDQRPAAAPSP
jgi:hypothetical protein